MVLLFTSYASKSIKPFVILAVLRRSVYRVRGVRLCIIATAGDAASFEKLSKRWQAVGSPVSDFICSRLEAHIYRSTDERVIAQPSHVVTLRKCKLTEQYEWRSCLKRKTEK